MTTAPLADFADIEGILNGDDAALLKAACEGVRSYCGWHIAPVLPVVEMVEVTHGVGVVRSLNVREVKAVGRRRFDGTIDDLGPEAVARVEVDQFSGVLRGLPDGRVQVTYDSGYDELPAGLAAVLASAIRGGRSSAVGGLLKQVGQVSYETGGRATSVAGLSADDVVVLDRYRLHPRP